MNSQCLCYVLSMDFPRMKESSLLVSSLRFPYAQVLPSCRKSKHVHSSFFATLQVFCKIEALLERHTNLYNAGCKAQALDIHIIVQKVVRRHSNLRLSFRTSNL